MPTQTANQKPSPMAQFATLKWQYPAPFLASWVIQKTHLDHYQHTNNVAYLTRLEKLAWEHSSALGLKFADYQTLDAAMVITQHQLNYHLPSYLGDTLVCATWIVSCDKKFRLSRYFQYINPETGSTIFSAQTQFVCVSLSTGRPKKMPESFKNIYASAVIA